MKKIVSIIAVAILALSMLTMVSCGKYEFSGQMDDDKNMTIKAVNADTGDYFVTGTLVVEEGEEIAIDTKLDKGEITVEFIASEDEESIDELPELDGDAAYTAYLSGTNSQAVSFGAGSFMIKPTVTDKASGTVTITVQPAK